MSLEQIGPAAEPMSDAAAHAASAALLERTGATDQSTEIFGSFWIEDTEFALPVTVIREVVNEPDAYAPIPMSPSHMVGLFNLRGMVIPVVDLSILLGFATPAVAGMRKIAIIENGDLCLGLLFDDTGGIVNSESAARVKFEANADGENDVIVDGVLKLDNGNRMIQILDPYEILKIERVPRVAKAKVDEGLKSSLGPRLNCISFELGHTQCAIDLRYVQEITDSPEVQKSQLAHGHVLGNIELRGRTMPVIDFRGFFGNEKPYDFNGASLSPRKLLVLKLPEGPVGLLVYSVESIISYFAKEILPFMPIALPRHDLIEGCLLHENDQIVILLDHDNLMRDPYLVTAAQSCREIYAPDADVPVETQKEVAKVRESYIVFSIGKPLALDVSCVSEIINRPETLMKPPYALDFVEGILNLRGELITLIDPHILYGIPENTSKCGRILILKSAGKKYGITVDSVDEIVNTTGGNFLDIPPLERDDTARIVSQDVLGCLSVPSRAPGSDPVMVLNVDALLSRCVGPEDEAAPAD